MAWANLGRQPIIEKLSSQPTKNASFSQKCCNESTRKSALSVRLSIVQVARRLGRYLISLRTSEKHYGQ